MKQLISAALLLCMASGCYYDDKETLYPVSNCNTSNVTYSATIKPLIQQHCAFSSCHAGAAPASGLDLSAHAGLQAVALNGKVAGVINHASGFSPMPKGSAKLPTCNLDQIAKWIADGALNN